MMVNNQCNPVLPDGSSGDTYESKDFYLAGFLMSSGISLASHHRKGQQTTFVFEDGERAKDLIAQYYAMQASVNPVVYGQAIRNLKSIIHANTNVNFEPIFNSGNNKCL